MYRGFPIRIRFEFRRDRKYPRFRRVWFRSWLDGGYFTEGPYRFDADHPQYEEREVTLAAGRHVLAAEVRADDVDTRILKKMPPFFGAEFICRGQQIGYGVKTALIDGIYLERRINPQLGYSEERDLNSIPLFINAGFDDGGWNAPVEVFPFGCVLTRAADFAKISDTPETTDRCAFFCVLCAALTAGATEYGLDTIWARCGFCIGKRV